MSSLDLIDSRAVNDSENLFSESANDDETEVELTAFEVIQKLQTAWINEHFSPELLEPQIEVVDCLLDQIKVTEENLEQLDRGHFGIAIHKMELSRVRFTIASYLRLRLQKIQKHVHYLSNRSDDEINARLTTEEATFLRNFKNNTDNLYKKLALNHIPGRSADISQFGENSRENSSRNMSNEQAPNPNLNAAVFVKAEEEVRDVYIEDEAGKGRDEELDMEKDSQHVIHYRSVSHLVQSGKVKLV